MMRIPSIIFGGPHHGSVVYDGRAVQVLEASSRPVPWYDASGETRPFVDDSVIRTIEASRIGIQVTVFVDGDQHVLREVESVFEEAVTQVMAQLANETDATRRANDPKELR